MKHHHEDRSRGSRWQHLITARSDDEPVIVDLRKTPGNIIQILLIVILFSTLVYCLYIARKTKWRKRNGQPDKTRDGVYKASCITLMIGLVIDIICLGLDSPNSPPAYYVFVRITAFPYLLAVLFFQGVLFHIIEQHVNLALPVWKAENLVALHGAQMTFLVLESFLQFVQYCALPAELVGSYYTGLFPTQGFFSFLQPVNYICVFLWLVAAIDVFFFACVFAIKKVNPRHHRLYLLGLSTTFLIYAMANVAFTFVIHYLDPPVIVYQAMIYISLLSKTLMYPLMIHLGPPTMIRTGGKHATGAEEEATEIPDRSHPLNAQNSAASQRPSVADSDLDGSTIHSRNEFTSRGHDHDEGHGEHENNRS